MKRIITIIIGLIFIVSVFSACSAKEEAEIPINVEQPSDSSRTAMAPFQMANSIYRDGAGNSAGFYTLRRNSDRDHEDMSRNILYIDYATKKQVYLCAQPNCSHDDDFCTSWIAPYYGEVVLAIAGDTLAVFYNGTMPRIDLMNLNGDNRRNLCTFNDGIRISTIAAYNEQYFALSVDKYFPDDEGNVKYTQTLCAIDINTGEQITVYSHVPETTDPTLAGNSDLTFMGVTDTGFIMSLTVMCEFDYNENPEITFENMAKATKRDIMVIPFDGSEVRTLLSYTDYKPCAFVAAGKHLFYFSSMNGIVQLLKIDAATGDATIIIENIANTAPETGITVETISLIDITPYIINDRLVVTYRYSSTATEAIYTCLSIDINTGELQEITLSYYYYAIKSPLPILAQFGDNLLVYAKAQEIDDGRAMPFIQLTPAIISADDYLASNPNFDWIETV